jgi:mannose/fructose/N-acetylgalactosamine-specific phosphotransferase system component IID
MKIEIPEGYTLPEDIADGGTLEELVTFKVEGEYLVPTMIAGVELAAEEAEDEEAPMEEEAVTEMEEAPMRGLGARVMGMA